MNELRAEVGHNLGLRMTSGRRRGHACGRTRATSRLCSRAWIENLGKEDTHPNLVTGHWKRVRQLASTKLNETSADVIQWIVEDTQSMALRSWGTSSDMRSRQNGVRMTLGESHSERLSNQSTLMSPENKIAVEGVENENEPPEKYVE